MEKQDVRGLYVATTTPFTPEGAVNTKAVAPLIDAMVEAGVSGFVPVGGTGEAASLVLSERVAMVEATVAAAAGRVPVIAGVTVPGLGEAAATGRALLDAGASALMVMTPYGVGVSQEGIRDYYKAMADAVGAPVLLYDIPYMNLVTTEPETVAAIVEDGSIFAMKASNPDLDRFARLAGLVADKIALMAGDEPAFVEEIKMGAVGGILASSAVNPATWVRIFDLATAGRTDEAQTLLSALGGFIDDVYSEPNPGPLKAALKLMGFDQGPVRTPMRAASAEVVETLRKHMDALNKAEAAARAGA